MASAKPKRGMGRGLDAILSAAPADAPEELRNVPLGEVVPNPRQPRTQFDEEALIALAESVKERGVVQPILVRPGPDGGYELVAGERRWRAAKLAGLDTVPAVVRPHDDAASLELAVIENLAREDLNPVEEARAIAALVEELGLTREQVGRRVGRSRAAVSNLMRLLDLPDDVLELLEQGRLSEGHGRALLLAEDPADRRRLARDAADGGLTVRMLEDRARSTGAKDAPAKPTPAPTAHPDEVAALRELSERIGRGLGADAAVVKRGSGYELRVPLDDLDALESLIGRLGG